MICNKCSKEIPDGSRFCPKCGNRVPEESKQISTENVVSPAETPIKQQLEQKQVVSAKFRVNRKIIILILGIIILAFFGGWFFENNPAFRFWESPSQLFARAQQLLQNAEDKKGAEYLVQADRRARNDCSGEERLNLRLQIRETYEAHRDALEEMNTYNYFNMDDIISSALREEECEESLKALGLKYEVVDGRLWAHSEDNRYHTDLRDVVFDENEVKLGFWNKSPAELSIPSKNGLFDERGYYYNCQESSGIISCWDLYGNKTELVGVEYGTKLIGLEDDYLYYLEDTDTEDGAIMYRISTEQTDDEMEQSQTDVDREELILGCESSPGAALLDGYLYYVRNTTKDDGYDYRLFRCQLDGQHEEQITGDLPLQYVSTGETVKWEDQDISEILSVGDGITMALENSWRGLVYIRYRSDTETTVYCTDGYDGWSILYDEENFTDDTGFYHIDYGSGENEGEKETYNLCRIVSGEKYCETLKSDIGSVDSVLYHSGDWVIAAEGGQTLKIFNISSGTMGEVSIAEDDGAFGTRCTIVENTLFYTGVHDYVWEIYRADLQQVNEGITKLSPEKCPVEDDFLSDEPCFLGEATENGEKYGLYSRQDGTVRKVKAY